MPFLTKRQPLLSLHLVLVMTLEHPNFKRSLTLPKKGTRAYALAGCGSTLTYATHLELILRRTPQVGPNRLPSTVLLPTSTKAVLGLAPEQSPSLLSAHSPPAHLPSPLRHRLSRLRDPRNRAPSCLTLRMNITFFRIPMWYNRPPNCPNARTDTRLRHMASTLQSLLYLVIKEDSPAHNWVRPPATVCPYINAHPPVVDLTPALLTKTAPFETLLRRQSRLDTRVSSIPV